jgi:hypothetical protein
MYLHDFFVDLFFIDKWKGKNIEYHNNIIQKLFLINFLSTFFPYLKRTILK